MFKYYLKIYKIYRYQIPSTVSGLSPFADDDEKAH